MRPELHVFFDYATMMVDNKELGNINARSHLISVHVTVSMLQYHAGHYVDYREL